MITTPSDLEAWRLFMGLRQSDVAQMYGITVQDVIQMEGKAATKPLHEGIIKNSGRKG